MTQYKARDGAYLGPITTWAKAVETLPRRERDVFDAISGRIIAANPGQWNAIEIDIFQVAKAITMKHDQASDAVRSLAQRRFHVVQGPKKVFEYPLLIIFGYHLRQTDKPIESIMVAVAHETSASDESNDEWAGRFFDEQGEDIIQRIEAAREVK